METINVKSEISTNNGVRIHTLFSQLEVYTKGQPIEELTPASIEIILSGIEPVKQVQATLREEPDKLLVNLE